ncbi:MAG TPA: hemerythrin domain-containing protein [Myxococcota bacterium]|nr:hemerythrin domain-containing protein [Myxococcota bacterium]
MLVFDVLKAEHSHIKDLLARMEATAGRATNSRSELYDCLRHDFLSDSEAEERIFYGALSDSPEMSELVGWAREDHAIGLYLLDALGAVAPDTEEWMAAVKTLKDNVELHIDGEEGELFRRARSLLSRKDAQTMAPGRSRLPHLRTPNPPMISVPTRSEETHSSTVG